MTFTCLRNTMAPGNQVKDQRYQSEDEQKVDHSTAYMQAETEQQQNQENNQNRPKHKCLLAAQVSTRKLTLPGACAHSN